MEQPVSLMRLSGTLTTCVLVLLSAIGPAAARERLFRVLDTANGLPGVPVNSVAQDTEGFIWIATARGLARYDGVEVRKWGRDDYAAPLDFVVAGPAREVLTARHRETLMQLSGDRLVPLPGPEGRPITGVWDADFDAEGHLWVVTDGRLAWRGVDGRWTVLAASLLDGERPFSVAPGCGRRMLVSTWERRLWDVAADGNARVLGGQFADRVRAMLCDRDGSVLAGVHWQGLWRLRDGAAEKLAHVRNRGLSLVARGDAVWYVTVDEIAVIEDGNRVTFLSGAERGEGFGEAIVDREGSLWIGSNRGLVHYAEPETIVLQEPDGLPVNHARFLARSDDRVWVSTWDGISHIEESGGTLRVTREPELLGRSMLCVDGDGRAWTLLDRDRPGGDDRAALVSLRNDEVRVHEIDGADPSRGFACARADDASVWIAFGGVLLRADTSSGALVREAMLPEKPADPTVTDLAESGEATLWSLVGAATVCRRDGRSATAGVAEPQWTCEDVKDAGLIGDLHVTPNDEIWIATDRKGVLYRGTAGWQAVPGLERYSRSQVIRLSPALSGGVWVSGPGFVDRAVFSGVRWAVVEELTTWHGIPPTSVNSVLEDADGTVWLASLAGVVRVPSGVRETVPPAPSVTVTDVLVGGRRKPLGDPLVLPWDRNRLEVRFSTLSFRAPHLLRYRVRTAPDDVWTETGEPSLRFVDLDAGRYTIELVASLDGRRWSQTPARLSLRVRPPWYRQAWAVIVVALLVVAASYGLYRMRMARVVGLERQRMRIAADLHDDMGAGLGGIGILAGVAAERETPDAERLTLATRIAEMAASLGAGLSDIVWSLRPDRGDLESLAHYVVERASDLFAAGAPVLVTRFPDPWPTQPLNLAVRRNLQLIALEALRNAARHAKARRVVLGFAREGRRWTMWVEDDGRGLAGPSAERSRGMGMSNMRARARDIGAELRAESAPQGGTRIEVRFRPRADGGAMPSRSG